ncbi:adenylylsulfate kinase /sulfate adenylyltransferase subunit 1 [Limimonas halophila]|uniref:Adenylyl-sulfate kinase n=1 Tax=Limimonas halophila TaxID=1082479 RepID=A0A1G7P309_9PROT|nr:adenylyl-sulfate kinase [Limimonas halophila]SDF80621.1 adenylylsulfate kinase /sulfate adenylyltransferase subunit 1 [Limimonas halophila]
MAIAQPNAPWQARELAKLVFVGHVDHGKSSLIGRLLYDTDSLPDGKFEELKAMSERRGMPLEWSFLLDAFQAERDQAVTIDTTQIQFRTEQRDYTIIDAPGHKEFLKNMVTGAANADAAVLVVDAREGVQEQTRRHGYLLHILGIKQVAVAVNKMDLVDFDEQRFAEVSQEVTHYLNSIGVDPTYIVPISARDGDNMATRSERTPWYDGKTVLDALDSFHVLTIPTEQPLRFPVQDVYKFDDRRLIAGRIESGILRQGDTLLFSPSNKTVRVRSIEAFNRDPNPVEARAGESVSITLDEQLFLERGEIASHEDNAPKLTNVFKGRIFWFGHEPLEAGKTLKMKLATREARVTVQAIDSVIDTDTLASRPAEQVGRNQIAEVVLRSKQVLAVDEFHDIMRTGRFVLIDGYDAVAGGVLSMEGYPDQRRALQVKSTNVYSVEHRVPAEARHERNGHIGGVLWFTGLSGAGKSTLAMEVENHLFRKGYQVYVLDGDNVRRGLNANLGFSPDDRAENIRRVGEAAALFADAGFIVITSFISPYRADRERARAAGRGQFHEIYVHADLETCEKRDPKGLYRRARAGEIQDFTGIHAPYEHPVDPELVVDTTGEAVEACTQQVLDYVESKFSLHPSKRVEVV